MIENKELKEVVNLVAPERITQRHLAEVLARADGIRRRVRLGKSLFRLLLGKAFRGLEPFSPLFFNRILLPGNRV